MVWAVLGPAPMDAPAARGDEADAVARIEERRGQRVGGEAAVPVEGGLAGDGAAEAVGWRCNRAGRDPAAVGAPADAAGVRIEDAVAGADDGLVVHLLGQRHARRQIDIVLLDGRGATAAVGAVAGEFESSREYRRPADSAAVGLRNDMTLFTSVNGLQMFSRRPRLRVRLVSDLDIVLHVDGVGLVTAAGFGHGVLRRAGAVHRAQQIAGIAEAGGARSAVPVELNCAVSLLLKLKLAYCAVRVLVVLQSLELEAEGNVMLAFHPQQVVLDSERGLRFVIGVRVGSGQADGSVIAAKLMMGKSGFPGPAASR